MEQILLYISIVSGGLLLLMMVLSLIGGDVDFEIDTDTDSGSFGWLKSILTFVSVSAGVARALLLTSTISKSLSIILSIMLGVVAVLLFSLLFKWLLSLQKDATWNNQKAIGMTGKAYTSINNRSGSIILSNGNEFQARSQGETIKAFESVEVVDANNNYLIVKKIY